MDGFEFFRKVSAHPELEWLGVREGRSPAEDEVFVGNKKTGAKFAFSVRAILDHPWEELEEVLLGVRPPKLMTHITRIVGYFSQLSNWNRSKLAELKDRHRGQYAVPEPQPQSTPAPRRRQPTEVAA